MSHTAPTTAPPRINPYVPYDFIAANKNYMDNIFTEHDAPIGGSSRVAIISCCDPRAAPEHFFQLKHNQGFVIRNSGGKVTEDVVAALAIVQAMGSFKEIMIVHHTGVYRRQLGAVARSVLMAETGCGALLGNDDLIRKKIAENGVHEDGGAFLDEAAEVAKITTFMPFGRKTGETERQALDRTVVEDVQFLRQHPLMKPMVPITGWVYNGHTGGVEPVECGLEDGKDPKQVQLLQERLARRLARA
jgi:carbonic anhydrase